MSLSGQQQRRQQVFSGQSQRYDYVRCSVHHRLDIDDARTRTQPSDPARSFYRAATLC